jgi:hypothetical protein
MGPEKLCPKVPHQSADYPAACIFSEAAVNPKEWLGASF